MKVSHFYKRTLTNLIEYVFNVFCITGENVVFQLEEQYIF